jgi:hypothetical protein
MQKIASALRSIVLIAQLREARQDVRDTQLAITHILLANGWAMNNFGKVVKEYRSPFQQARKFYILETAPNGFMFVRDQSGKVWSRVDLSKVATNDQIMQAARELNNGAAKVKAAEAT